MIKTVKNHYKSLMGRKRGSQLRILFVLKRSGIAGVETLAMRMARSLSNYGYEIDIFLVFRGDNQEFLNEAGRYATILGWKNLLVGKARNQAKYDYVYAFEIYGASVASFLVKTFFKNSIFCFGAYHPNEYAWDGPNSFLAVRAERLIMASPKTNIFFMNEAVRDHHRKRMKLNLEESPIIPIGIDVLRFNKCLRKPIKGKIISVGRITNFKTYNFHMVNVICELRERGLDVTYDIYGDGELLNELRDLINEKNAFGFIRINGPINYAELEAIFSEAYIFVGCGAAIVEASAAGVPCLLGIDSWPTAETYGFFSTLTGYSVGERSNELSTYNFIDIINDSMNLDEERYSNLCNLHRERAKQFSLETTTALFLQALRGSKGYIPPIGLWELSKLVFWFTFTSSLKVFFGNPLKNRYLAEN